MAQRCGTAFPNEINNLFISNTGAGINGIVSQPLNDLNINGSLFIQSGELRPYDASSIIRLDGNFLINGIYNGTLNPAGNPTSSEFVF